MKLLQVAALFIMILFLTEKTFAQNPENWTSSQLIQPAQLAASITADKNVPVIISVGPGAPIPHSINIGMLKDGDGLTKLKKELGTLPKETKIVIYCGCCPFEHCPNARPAITALKDMKFTNYQLLNLPHNIKADWIDKGYPVAKQ